ncbi:MAG: sulfurtransferase [Candidatus Magasanikbacteria bacterium CG11_big_fil_rev_8_21_14_0_20_39_34]|uniref:Sulfurtransferase n=1 Tax=Candidatus Magasanikbacteria bacterium CG11_big_fil_rev_8_21_14_0_20_39_34 TaxID=1974653 RepID=A0A2H0N541_9BACT|nr:MAG: sulfurtransferase [Candidatus Magasanikbacteria bacterium CG11_big_fil_rev_8_21_14_0_20_39_34]
MIFDVTFNQARELEGIHKDVFFVDVREKDEWQTGHIKDAQHIPFSLFDHLFKERLPDKKAAYIVYCASGGRSRRVCDFLEYEGYENIYNLLGGISGVPESEVEV